MSKVQRGRDDGGTELDPVAMLKEDHETVKGLFEKVEALGDGAVTSRRELAERICDELELHAEIEERLFYPALQESGDSDLEDVVAESYEEHRLVKDLVAQIRGWDPADHQYAAKLKVLRELVLHHVEEEESEMLSEARAALGDDEDVESLAEEMAAMKAQRKAEIARRGESLPQQMLESNHGLLRPDRDR
jgi:hemerythrin-like domain-containing protein